MTQPSESLYLLYHELRPRRSDYSYVVETTAFERQCDLFLKLRNRKEPGLSPEVTFDDGHVSNFEFALPILHARAIQAWFFITVGWTGQRPHYMDWQQLRTLHEAGQQIGAHGWTHTLLTHCRTTELQKELAEARLTLEDKLGTSITTMSLPGGRANPRVIQACRDAGYTQIFTSIPKREPRPAGAMIGRLNIRGDMTLEWLERLFEPKSNVLSSLARQHQIKTAAKSLLGDSLYEKLWGLVNRQESETHIGDATAREDSAHHQ
ncbi:polysaccharide deacetylase family protein [Tunturiibacter lichenicola]|uniref:polysaccharide deacetylase family protein n=1 Tax=Tunturiibacter lichenicola TaxID=2051959 RepID=UPI0021B4AFD7|nr:polysaccharide deacetylase family protein [Edaphobacter lichenicola]